MRAIFICILVIISSKSYAQFVGDRINIGGGAIEVIGGDEGNVKTVGSPYINETYFPAVVEGYDESIELRYNAYTDEMEFEVDETLYALSKNEYPRVVLGWKKKTPYIYTTYQDGANLVSGFLRIVNEKDKYPLYVKETVSFSPSKKATSGYDSDKPEVYKREKDRFFTKIENQIVEVPLHKKNILKLFPEFQKEIQDFLKSEKVKLNSQDDMVRVFNYLNSL